jgi:hypothetical protein
MTEPFFNASEMLALQEAARPALQTDIKIYHRTPTDTSTGPASNDYGDDAATYPVVQEGSPLADVTVKGMLYQRPTPVAGEDPGEIVTANTYRLFVPLGTRVYPHDEVEANDEHGVPVRYEVTDTNADITWKAYVTCSLRRLE